MVKTRVSKVASEFDEMLNRMARERVILGKDRKMKSVRRLTLAMTRHNLMKQIAQDIIVSDLKDE